MHITATGTPLSAADIAAHGELYDYISFPNIPQWVAMCTIPVQLVPPGQSSATIVPLRTRRCRTSSCSPSGC